MTMGNGRKFRRQRALAPEAVHAGPASAVAWREQIRKDRAGHHGMNAWHCDTCGHNTVTIDVDPGVTPMFLGCRHPDGCKAMAVSAGYPEDLPPAGLEPAWEWRLPTEAEWAALSPPMRDHVNQGGLVLHPRSSGRPSAYLPEDDQ